MAKESKKTVNKGIKERDLIVKHSNRTEAITWGYMRVSTKQQHLDRQEEALIKYGVKAENIISDKASGKDFNREGYLKLKKCLKAGDTLVIKELDRIGREKELMTKEWQDLQKMGVDIVVIDTPILNTAGKDDLTKQLIGNIVFELLTYMAEQERIKIKQRQAEGLEKAKERGVKIGRPSKSKAVEDAIKLYTQNKSFTVAKILEMTGISRATFYKGLREAGLK